jgi:YD repeat-containing protein
MPHIEESIDIAAPLADVFRYCHDIARRPRWDVQATHVELLSPAPIRQGTLFRVDASYGGGAVFSWDAEYIGFQFPLTSRVRVIDTAPSSPFATGSEVTWQFSSVGGQTRFTWTWDYKARGFLSRITDLLGGQASVRRGIRRSLAKLKELLEKGERVR